MNPRQKNSHYSLRPIFFGLVLFGLVTPASFAEIVAIDVSSRETIAEADPRDRRPRASLRATVVLGAQPDHHRLAHQQR